MPDLTRHHPPQNDAAHNAAPQNELTHLDERGRARMVDVSAKDDTVRIATARGRVLMRPETLRLIRSGGLTKGDVLAIAQVAGVMGAKRTSDLIPLCHPLPITGVNLAFDLVDLDDDAAAVEITASARIVGKTGVEMEALTAVATAALTVYDMCKAVDKDMVIDQIRLVHKVGGKSGEYIRDGEPNETGSPVRDGRPTSGATEER
jgi:cyclic pyranopterin phosphate synthase